MTGDEAQHEISRILRQLYADSGVMIASMTAEWYLHQVTLKTQRPPAEVTRLTLTTVVIPQEARQ